MSKETGQQMSETDLIAIVVKRMKDAKLDPASIYAFEKTGMLVGESNLHLFSKADIKEWTDAVAEYRRKHK